MSKLEVGDYIVITGANTLIYKRAIGNIAKVIDLWPANVKLRTLDGEWSYSTTISNVKKIKPSEFIEVLYGN